MEISFYAIDLKDAALLDYYTGALWYGREQSFSIEQLSAFFTLVHTLIHNIKGNKPYKWLQLYIFYFFFI